MRTRTRSAVIVAVPAKGVIPYSGMKFPCTGTASVITGSSPAKASILANGWGEGMSDSLGKNIPHSCVHRRMDYDLPMDVSSCLGYPNLASPWGYFTYGAAHESEFNEAFRYADSLISGWSLTPTYANISVTPPGWTMTAPSYTETHVVNDLFDKANQLVADGLLNLSEANEFLPTLSTLANCIPQLRNNWRSIRQIVKNASDTYLSWKFGISPIISDIQSLRKALPRMEANYNNYVNQKPIRVSKVIPLTAKFSLPGYLATANGVDAIKYSFQGLPFGTGIMPCIRYVLIVKPSLTYQTDLFKRLNYLMSRFSTSPATFAWEKVPFSFVADWFVDLREPLRTLDNLCRVNPYKVVSLTRSMTYDVTTMGLVDYRSTCGGGSLWSQRTVTRRYKHYERSPISPGGFSLTWAGRFGKNKFGISASLIAQRLNRVRSKRS